MYEAFYGFKTKPFSLLPDPAFLYRSRKHQLALAALQYAVQSRLALSVVTGEVGSGKTTLVRQLINELGDTVTVGLISNTHRGFGNLMQWVALAFGLPFRDKDKVELYHDFVEFLCGEYAKGRHTLLIVDEAQNLDVETLEELRLLTNVNSDDHMVLQMLVVGQPELHDTLKRHDLRQLAQRISVAYRLEPLEPEETAAYVRHRLTAAGGNPNLFHKNALRLIHSNSGGIPRVINTLCDLALVYGYADEKKQIDALLIADIARDRIDTGLYGDKVYDVSSLNLPKRASSRRRAPSGGEPAAAASEELAHGDEPASEEAGSGEMDLIVDGSAPETPAASEAAADEEPAGDDDDEPRPRGAKVTTLRADGGGERRKQGR
ncbi:MAG TPA: AAA family ATPase [Gammaproteobacteria bacterium]|nr:AAA family ATPase [Gammaproteobacteria bacterium]